MRAFLTSTVFILTFLFFETCILSNVLFMPIVPDFLLLFTVYISIQKGSFQGETVGFFSGLLLDFVSAAPLGLNALLRTTIGFIGGIFHLTISTSGLFTPIVIGVAATGIKVLFTYFVSFFFPGIVLTYSFFSTTFLYECIFNGLLAPVMFFIFSKNKTISIVSVSSVADMEK
ncbi:MAG: rod shape-determining protein MreD [Treponemataceae bacterium]|nr:rod shape-determining protein MreD [Treponemataceae bacterium]